MSFFRRAGALIARFFNSAADPAAVASEFKLYSKDDGGVSQLFGRSDDGTVHQITPASGGAVVHDATLVGDGSLATPLSARALLGDAAVAGGQVDINAPGAGIVATADLVDVQAPQIGLTAGAGGGPQTFYNQTSGQVLALAMDPGVVSAEIGAIPSQAFIQVIDLNTATVLTAIVVSQAPGGEGEIRIGFPSTPTQTLGFFGTVPVTQPTAVPVTAADIHAALVALGLIT